MNKQNQRRILGTVACACILSLTPVSVPHIYGAENSGPGFDTSLTSPPVGPGFTSSSVGNISDYYNKGLPSSTVQTAEKYSYEQMVTDIHTLEKQYGNLMTVEIIGQSADKRDIYNIIVGNPKSSKHIMVQSGIHAREHMTSLLVMKQLEQLLAFYDSGTFNDQPISSMLNQVAIHFVPMVSPDGVSISQFGENAIQSEELRQIIKDSYALDLADGRTTAPYDQYLSTWKSNARGVDLNHNFDVGWASLNGAMTHTSGTDYKGPSPLSEPESAAMANLISRYPFTLCLNYHAMGQVIYWDTADNQQRDASLRFAQAISASNGYQILNSQGRGGIKDWVQSMSGAIPSITVEIGKTACPLPLSEFEGAWEQNKSGIILAVDFALKN